VDLAAAALLEAKNHFWYELLYRHERQICAILFLLHRPARVSIGAMGVRSRALPTGLFVIALALSSCAKKHPATVALPVPPQIQSVETGLASWYGHPYHGRPAANGEIYDMENLTAAHRTLPFGTRVRVTNLANQKTVDVRIIDRGPFIDGRIIDLSHAAAEAIALVGPGIAQVRLDLLSVPELSPTNSLFAVQAGAFLDKNRAERLCASLDREYGPTRVVLRAGSPSVWRVLVGSEPTEDAAKALASRIRHEIGNAFVVRLDSPSTATKVQAETGANP
jgi:rare lipoprotein A